MLLSSKLTIDLITIPVYRFFKILVTDKPGMIKRNCVQVFDVG